MSALTRANKVVKLSYYTGIPTIDGCVPPRTPELYGGPVINQLQRAQRPIGVADERNLYQDGKRYLGLNEYRMRSTQAIKKHRYLVFVANSFVHFACLPPSLTKASLPVKTMREACREQTQARIEAVFLPPTSSCSVDSASKRSWCGCLPTTVWLHMTAYPSVTKIQRLSFSVSQGVWA